MNFINGVIEIIKNYHTSLLLGIRTTLIVALLGTIFGLVIGLFVGGVRAIKLDFNSSKLKTNLKKLLDTILGIYIGLFRGTPMMVQAAFIYYALLNVFHWTPLVAAIFVISINTGAYMSEIVRAGIQAVDPGQKEAARSLGMSNMETMFYVIIPQAIKNVFPAIGNEFVVNIKDSSVLMIISITELMFQSKSIAGSTFKFTETYFIEAMIYLILTSITTIILNIIEKKLNKTKVSLPFSDSDPSSMNYIRNEAD